MRLVSLGPCEAPLVKLRDYLLNQTHADGGPKARFFESFGYSQPNITAFAAALIDHPRNNQIVQTSENKYGVKSVVVCNLETPDKRNPCIFTVWIREGDGPARLVTAYPKSPGV